MNNAIRFVADADDYRKWSCRRNVRSLESLWSSERSLSFTEFWQHPWRRVMALDLCRRVEVNFIKVSIWAVMMDVSFFGGLPADSSRRTRRDSIDVATLLLSVLLIRVGVSQWYRSSAVSGVGPGDFVGVVKRILAAENELKCPWHFAVNCCRNRN